MTSGSDRALDFLEDWSEYYSELVFEEANIKFTPHYVYWQCDKCESSFVDNDCYGNGKYCAMEPSDHKITGRQIIDEDLRQKCLYTNIKEVEGSLEKWFQYIERVHSECYGSVNEDCSFNAHKHLGLDFDDTQQCVRDSFS